MWINGGYFVFRREIFDFIEEGEELVREPFDRIMDLGRLSAYRHNGFWVPMDTIKDKQALDEMYQTGDAPVVRLGRRAPRGTRRGLTRESAGTRPPGTLRRRARPRSRGRLRSTWRAARGAGGEGAPPPGGPAHASCAVAIIVRGDRELGVRGDVVVELLELGRDVDVQRRRGGRARSGRPHVPPRSSGNGSSSSGNAAWP